MKLTWQINFSRLQLSIRFVEFCHTGDIESLNSLQLKYANKTDHFGWLGMLIRSCLAAIDFNESVDRPQKTSTEGKELFREKVDRSGHNRTMVPVRVEKNESWKVSIMEKCVECLRTELIPNPQVI